MSSWRDSESYFVSPVLDVYSVVDLSSYPLKVVRRTDVGYNGPKDEDYRSLLFKNDFAANHTGEAIVRARKHNKPEEDDYFLVKRMVEQVKELDSLLKENGVQGVKELKSLLDNTKAELVKQQADLGKKEAELAKNKADLATKDADLAKKSADVDALQRKIVDWNSDELRLTLEAIAAATKKVFVDFADLKAPPASTDGDPKPVLEFVRKLRDLIVGKGFGDTFLGDANKILASIATIFNQRNGLSIDGMVSTTTRTPADLIQDLNSLKTFMENRFFIDGTVIVKSYGLMKEQDIPVIFRNIEVGEAELHRKDVGPKSIVNLYGESIFYGYFNIPSFGKFKGILTRSDVLPNEIMEKLRHSPYRLDDKGFWFVKANGEALFDGSTGVDFLGFLRRIKNKTFVNKGGKYLKFEFTTVKVSGLPSIIDNNSVTFIDAGWGIVNPFRRVQFDRNESPQPIPEGRALLPLELSPADAEVFHDILIRRLGKGHVFLLKDLCFIGNITEISHEHFRDNTLVGEFFERLPLSPGEVCYVDAQATTFFVCNPDKSPLLNNVRNVAPKLLTG